MRFGLRAASVEDVNKVKTSLIKSRRIIFTPSVDLKDELASTAIQIICIDRYGNEVKRVTSTSGDVEDNEDNGTTDSTDGTDAGSSQGGSTDSGSGSGSGSSDSSSGSSSSDGGTSDGGSGGSSGGGDE